MPRGGRKRGADTYKHDRDIVPWLTILCRVAKLKRGWDTFTTIRKLVEAAPGLPLWGKGAKATYNATHRLYQKVTSGRYGEPKLPPGIHYSHLTLEPYEEPRSPEESSDGSDGSSKSKSRIA